MDNLQIRAVDRYPEPDFAALQTAAFADFGHVSAALAAVLAEEAAHRSQVSQPEVEAPFLRLGAFVENHLIGWSYSQREGNQLHMVNSGVAPELRRRGVYTSLVAATIEYAERQG